MKEFFEDKKDDVVTSTNVSGFVMLWAIIVLIWFVVGFCGLVASLLCFAFNGSITDKTVGFLLAVITGPFYWLYFIFNSKYCTRKLVDDF